ncbi:MAG: metal-dependent hydrolase [Bacteroidota bacterium]
MDSLTQIVLGAAVGEAVLGKKVGNKAMLYGAIAGTIPDLDVLTSHVTDSVTALSLHRGFTHSIVFSVAFAPAFGWLVARYERLKDVRAWSWLFFWAFLTHPLLDAHTTWGTQLFWPFEVRLAFKTIFVIDPLYTLPFLACLLLAMVKKRTNPRRQFYNKMGLWLSSSYLVATFLLKGLAYRQFEVALQEQGISYAQLDTRPSPLNTILWSANVDADSAYLLANYSFFDTRPITFTAYPKNHHLLGDLAHNVRVQQMIAITEGWYIVRQKEGKLYFSDLRFGLISLEPNAQDFAFNYQVVTDSVNQVEFVEVPKDRGDAQKLLGELWDRVKGN